MGKSVFDYNDGDFIFSTSSLGFDSDGNMMMHLGDNMALEVDSGELHIVSSWENEEYSRKCSCTIGGTCSSIWTV